MKVFADMHTHTKFSVDGREDINTMCRAAIDKGLKFISFTEHFDMNPNDSGYLCFDYERFSEAIEAARDEFGDKIKILKGLEFAEPHLYPKEFENLSTKNFDVILGSVHWLGNKLAGDKVLLDRYTLEQVFEKYYTEVFKAVRFGGFDVLAHFDLPKRYFKASYQKPDITNKILDRLIKSGIALEINTSPIRKGLNECMPGSNVFERYIRAGGSRITVGSDAHSSSEIAADFEYAIDIVTKHKSGQIGIFENRKFVPIEIY